MTNWILHDFMQVNGGAERLVITLANGLPNFRIGTSGVYADFQQTGDLKNLELEIPAGLKFLPRLLRALLSFYSGRFPICAGDTVVYSGIFAPLAALRHRGGRKIYYCHTPPRFALDRRDQYLAQFHSLFRPALALASKRYLSAYMNSLRKMEIIIENSNNIAGKLDQIGFHADVVYPPINVHEFKWLGQEEYFLSVGRLEPNKRIDLIVEAFRLLPEQKLVVISGGSQLLPLQQLADGAPNISILGWQTDSELVDWIGRARAVIYIPRDEDFGMSAVEAMAAGKPVIAADEGGFRETIVNGETGLLIVPELDSLRASVRFLDADRAASMRSACEARAARYSTSHSRLAAKREALKLPCLPCQPRGSEVGLRLRGIGCTALPETFRWPQLVFLGQRSASFRFWLNKLMS